VDIEQLVSMLRVWFQRTEQSWDGARNGTDNVVTFPSVAG
jgi:hypothetical protein